MSSCLFKKVNYIVSNNFVTVSVSALNFISDIRGENVLAVFTLFMTLFKHAYHTLRSNKWEQILSV